MNRKELLGQSFTVMPFVRISLFILWIGTLFFNSWKFSVIVLCIYIQFEMGKIRNG